jgi:hypothetical protein
MHNKLATARLQWLEAQTSSHSTIAVSDQAEADRVKADREALGLPPATIIITGVPRAEEGNTDAQD